LEKGFWSSFSGVAAVIVGNPPDICLVRAQTDSMLPAAERRNYKGVFDALRRIVKEEGVKTLWRGSVTNMVRAVAMNVGMLATYDEAKERIMHFRGQTRETMADRLLYNMFIFYVKELHVLLVSLVHSCRCHSITVRRNSRR
jgi:solute carrier family 25 oxoglutarate transporter 11